MSKEPLREYVERTEKAKKEAARWERVALIGMCLSAGFMAAGIILRIVMAMRGIG